MCIYHSYYEYIQEDYWSFISQFYISRLNCGQAPHMQEVYYNVLLM